MSARMCIHFQLQVRGAQGLGSPPSWVGPVSPPSSVPASSAAFRWQGRLHDRQRTLEGRRMLQKESWRGRVEMGICTVVQGRRPGWMWSGTCRKEGARVAEWAQ